jgi:hypothetical protein
MSKHRRVLVGAVGGAVTALMFHVVTPTPALAQSDWFLVCSEDICCTMSYTGFGLFPFVIHDCFERPQ